MKVSGAPVLMTGPAVSCNAGNSFNVSGTLAGSCTETYTLSGSFTSPNQFTATFTAQFTPQGAGACLDCVTQQFSVMATRNP